MAIPKAHCESCSYCYFCGESKQLCKCNECMSGLVPTKDRKDHHDCVQSVPITDTQHDNHECKATTTLDFFKKVDRVLVVGVLTMAVILAILLWKGVSIG